jgi:inorganic pyrophosphatase
VSAALPPGAGAEFWACLDTLVASSRVALDRPKGAPHPRFPQQTYPLDYGYLEGTQAADGGGIDVWVGSHGGQAVSGLICSVDLLKRDAEIKILLGCTPQDCAVILDFMNQFSMRAILLPREG